MPNNRTSKYVRPKLLELQGEIDISTHSWRVYTPLSEMYRLAGRKPVRTYLNAKAP